MRARRVLIVGAGIGGLILARFLARDGHQVELVERTLDFSAQGHAIGFRGVGFQVLEKLGLGTQVLDAGRDFKGNRSFTFSGEQLRFTTNQAQARAVGGVAVMLRGMLHEVLARDLPSAIKITFGARPTAIRQSDSDVSVDLDDLSSRRCDILVGADGVHSAVRKLVLPQITPIDFAGTYVGMTSNGEHGLPRDEIATFYGKARLVALFPLSADRVTTVVYQDDGFPSPPSSTDAGEWTTYFNQTMQELAPRARRVLQGLTAADSIFFDRIRQVPASQVTAGRVALIGDAGYCPTFMSGNGAALAALGAYCLAECFKRHDDDLAALSEYQRRILPQAQAYQANARRMRKVLFARSPLALATRHAILKYAPQSALMRDARRHYRGAVRIDEVLAQDHQSR